jgi:hypothetical protein
MKAISYLHSTPRTVGWSSTDSNEGGSVVKQYAEAGVDVVRLVCRMIKLLGRCGAPLAAIMVLVTLAGCKVKPPSPEKLARENALRTVFVSATSTNAEIVGKWGMTGVELFGYSSEFAKQDASWWGQCTTRWWPSAWWVKLTGREDLPPSYTVLVHLWCRGAKPDCQPMKWERTAIVHVVQGKSEYSWLPTLVRFEGDRVLTFGAQFRRWLMLVVLASVGLIVFGFLTWVLIAGVIGDYSNILNNLLWFVMGVLPFGIASIIGVAVGTWDAFGKSDGAAFLGVLSSILLAFVVVVIGRAVFAARKAVKEARQAKTTQYTPGAPLPAFDTNQLPDSIKRQMLNTIRIQLGQARYDSLVAQFGEDALIQMALNLPQDDLKKR